MSISIDEDVTPTDITNNSGSNFTGLYIVESARTNDYITKFSSGRVADNDGTDHFKFQSTVNTITEKLVISSPI